MAKRSKARGDAETGSASCKVCTKAGPKATVKLCLQRTKQAPSNPLKAAPDVCSFMHEIGDDDRERFHALHLDVHHRIVGVDDVAVGTLTNVEVHPREVFKAAILANAAELVLVHNHPSGDATPSRQDRELTERLRKVGDLVGIKVLDSVVVGANRSCQAIISEGKPYTAEYSKGK